MLKKLRGVLVMVRECVVMSFHNIFASKMRSFLTVLGIMIGVAAVIALITTVSGVTGSISSSFDQLGAGTLIVTVAGSDLKDGLSAEDLAELSALDSVDGLTPTVNLSVAVTHNGERETSISVSGKNAYYFHLNQDTVKRGRALNFIDDDNASYVCLISDEMVETFFFGVDPLDKTIYLNGIPFIVVGLFGEDEGGGVASIFNGKSDIFIPYTAALKMNNANVVTSFTAYIADVYTSSHASDDLEASLDAMFSYEEDTYTILSMDSIEETMEQMMGMLASLLAGIASIALLVGGIGIMNMMLTTVTERTVEIGLKKAVGAMPWQIQLQFLIESFLLSLIGGIAGVLVGLLASLILCQMMSVTFVLNGSAIALGVGFSAAVGILFGWAPARKASRLNPIDALRSV